MCSSSVEALATIVHVLESIMIISKASFQGARKIGGSAWYTLFAHVQSLLGNLHTIRYTNHALTVTNKAVYLTLPADKPDCRVMLSVRYIWRVLKSKWYRFDSNGLYHLVQGNR